jgi:hypothetical protein
MWYLNLFTQISWYGNLSPLNLSLNSPRQLSSKKKRWYLCSAHKCRNANHLSNPPRPIPSPIHFPTHFSSSAQRLVHYATWRYTKADRALFSFLTAQPLIATTTMVHAIKNVITPIETVKMNIASRPLPSIAMTQSRAYNLSAKPFMKALGTCLLDLRWP